MRNEHPTRRAFLATALATAAAGTLVAQSPQVPQRDWTGVNPVRYPDPDIISLDKRFNKYKLGNTPIRRLYTGMLWPEGPAWNGVGRYLV